MALLVSTAAPGAAADAVTTAANPLTCDGYPEKRVFLESQGWWTPAGSDVDHESEHIHVGACFPHAQRVSGVLELDVRVMLHDMPGRVNFVRAAIGSNVVTRVATDLRCDGGCTRWYKLRVDTAAWPRDGRQELRLTANVQRDDGNRQYQSTGWQVYFANGKPVSHYRSDDLAIARGWYDLGFGYANATLHPPVRADAVSGTWRPKLSFSKSRYFVSIDPSFHGGSRGQVVAEGSGSSIQPAIDTTKLTDGAHTLFIRTDDVRSTGINSGVLTVPFVVRNGGTPPPADTEAPSAPANVRATDVRSVIVDLAWAASRDNVGVARYNVYRGSTIAGSTTGTTFRAHGLSCGTAYTFAVEAVDGAGNRSARSSVDVKTAGCSDASPPTAPTGLRVASKSPTSLELSWTASADNSRVTGYELSRDGVVVGRTSTTAFTFGGLDCSNGHSLAVTALDAAGNRSPAATRVVRCTWA